MRVVSVVSVVYIMRHASENRARRAAGKSDSECGAVCEASSGGNIAENTGGKNLSPAEEIVVKAKEFLNEAVNMVQGVLFGRQDAGMCVCAFLCVFVRERNCEYGARNAGIYVCACVCMYVSVCVYIYIYIYIYI